MNTARAESWYVESSAVPAFREPAQSLTSAPDEVMTPEQFFTPADRTAIAWPGERRLLLAVLEDAVASFLCYRHSQTKRGKRLFREDESWFTSLDQSSVFSFESICAHLNLDPDYIRRGLRQLPTSEAALQPGALGCFAKPRRVIRQLTVGSVAGGAKKHEATPAPDQPSSPMAALIGQGAMQNVTIR
jgi:hypothetical protein